MTPVPLLCLPVCKSAFPLSCVSWFPGSPVCLHHCLCVRARDTQVERLCALCMCVGVCLPIVMTDKGPSARNATCRGGTFSQGSLSSTCLRSTYSIHLYPSDLSCLLLTVYVLPCLSVCATDSPSHPHTSSYTHHLHCYSWEEQTGLAVGWFMSMNSMTPPPLRHCITPHWHHHIQPRCSEHKSSCGDERNVCAHAQHG